MILLYLKHKSLINDILLSLKLSLIKQKNNNFSVQYQCTYVVI